LKLSDTYGPEDKREKLFTLLRRTAQSGTPLNMSAGEQLLDLVYVDDIVDGYLLTASRLLTGEYTKEQFQLSSGRMYSLKDVVRIYESIKGLSLDVNFGVLPYREREVMTPWQAGSRLHGWSSKVGLEEGIRRMESII
jgi:nucleoside-diphosphate-sugar epimerase